ncbi:MAG TPA: hypothetical protein VF752_02650 [Thermoleophilaceae bacterium]
MDSHESQTDKAERLPEDDDGFRLHVTPRGALVLQTENARRMMRRLGRFAADADDVAADAVEPSGAAPAGP